MSHECIEQGETVQGSSAKDRGGGLAGLLDTWKPLHQRKEATAQYKELTQDETNLSASGRKISISEKRGS